MKEITYKKCKACGGLGKIPILKYSENDKKIAIKLRELGISYRKIADMLGIDHPQKIKHMLSK